MNAPESIPEVASVDDRPPEFTDEALALTFAARHQNHLRYCAAWGKWLLWSGERWQIDDTLYAFNLARSICREAASRSEEKRLAIALASAKTVSAVERLAKSDRRMAATADQWDRDPWILNTPGGLLELRTGCLRDHDPDDHLTKITGDIPGGNCPTWMAYLETVTAGDRELLSFLQRLAGYAMTGDTSEHALFFVHGNGANGKTVFTDTIAGILGDYHKTAPIETFTASSGDRHPTDLAGLRGARLVTAVETEEGRRWDESRIKVLTGGDTISARFMRQDFFEFKPHFKLLIVGNHKPSLRSVDEAIRRRLNLIPFTVTIPPAQRDQRLKEKLREEWPGILRWMLEGCLEWQNRGLCPPEAVKLATDAYLDGEDSLATWLEECCETAVDYWESFSFLYGSWTAWAESSGEFVGSQKRLAQQLEARGFAASRRNPGRGYQGLRVARRSSTPAHRNGC